ncbi:MAG: hypothetical protein GC185_07715 [Alphaproteobacteria bacterium]|nr:hypothetical protein [Alphaproteobacteria bacterium]
MTDANTDDLNKSLAAMAEKTRALNDSLKALASEGFDALSRGLSSTGAAGHAASRQPAGDIALQSLSKLLKQELTDSIGQLFAPGGSGGAKLAGGGGFAGGEITVVVNNNTSAAVTATQTGDAFDRKTLEITIDQMVANSLLRGRQTSGVLRTLFGIVPGLIGR